ncbi:MAG: 6-bladed beta-propeller [Bacteroidales bacterium]|jgi:hypothetical protein
MLKVKSLPILAVFGLLSACTPKTDTGPQIIVINEAHFTTVPLEKVLAASEFIPLEFKPESALSEFATFINWTSGFYLMDLYKKKMVLQFDKQGRFVRTIGIAGQGPGEYNQMAEALVTKKGVEILCGGSSTQVFKYDQEGRYMLTEKILDKSSSSFGINPENGDYYFYSASNKNLIWQVKAKSLQPVDSFVLRNPNIMTPGVQAFSATALGSVLFYQPFDDRIFELNGKGIRLKYRFDVGPSTPKYDELDTETQNKMVNEQELWFIYKALENSKWLYLLVAQQVAMDETQSQFYSLIMDKKTGKIYSLPDTPEPGPLFRPAFALDEDNILYSAVQPALVYESVEWKAEFQKKNLPLTADGNYVVVKISLDKIVQ